MPYATLQTLIDQFGEDEVIRSSDRDIDGVADTDVIDRALEGADGIIDSRLAVVYKLPIIDPPLVLVHYAGDIALYRLSYDAGTLTEEKRKRYEDALRWLDLIAAGKAVLPGAPEPDTKTAGGIRMTAEPREFTRAKMRGML